MEKINQFVTLWHLTGFLITAGISAVVTGFVAAATGIYDKPSGWKTGVICGIAFTFGSIAVLVTR